MKKVTRNEMFETNSSSVHTIVYSYLKREKSDLDIYVDKDGRKYCKIKGGYYGMSGVLATQQEKLNYLIGWLFIKNGGDVEELYRAWEYTEVQKWICEYAGIDYLDVDLVETYGYTEEDDREVAFDHQSSPWEDECVVNYYDKDRVLDFVFGDGVTLEMSCD